MGAVLPHIEHHIGNLIRRFAPSSVPKITRLHQTLRRRIGRAKDKLGLYPSQGDPVRIMARYIETTPAHERGLNLGCGGATFPGWINIDGEYPWHVSILWDLRGGLPFVPDETMAAVYSEHFMEHIPRPAAEILLREAHRVLLPGAYVRIAMPDLDSMVKAYGVQRVEIGPDINGEFGEQYGELLQTRGEWLNIAMRHWGHTYLYNFEDIERILIRSGFVDVRRQQKNVSAIPLTAKRETRSNALSDLIVEARKPS